MSIKLCNICLTEKDISSFQKHKKYIGGYRNFCLDCAKDYNLKYQINKGRSYKDFLRNIGCECCGFKHPDALEVHHLASEYKRYGRSQSRTHNLDDYLSGKAVILCANCHVLFHGCYGGKVKPFPLLTKDETISMVKKSKEQYVDTAS